MWGGLAPEPAPSRPARRVSSRRRPGDRGDIFCRVYLAAPTGSGKHRTEQQGKFGVRHLNYNQLLYFWTVASEGSVARASEVLHVAPQTVSGQIKRLEATIGTALFERDGRALVLTETGRSVALYADEMFTLGQELTQVVRRGARPRTPRAISVGVLNSLAKLITCELVTPALDLPEPVRLVTHEGTLEELLAALAVHRLDIVLSDRPAPADMDIRAQSQLLGASDIAFFATAQLAASLGDDFPRCLDGAPMLMPAPRTQLRARLDDWFAALELTPVVVAEVDDSALMKAFGQASLGLFAAPASIAQRICRSYGLVQLGSTSAVTERYYAIVPKRQLTHPGVLRITERARTLLEDEVTGADTPENALRAGRDRAVPAAMESGVSRRAPARREAAGAGGMAENP